MNSVGVARGSGFPLTVNPDNEELTESVHVCICVDRYGYKYICTCVCLCVYVCLWFGDLHLCILVSVHFVYVHLRIF